MPGDPVCRLLSLADVTPSVEAAWRDLAERAAEPNPCNEPDMAIPAMRHLPGGDRVRLLMVTRDDRIDACLPVRPVRRWRSRLPVPALTAWSHDFQVLGTPLVDATRTTESLRAMLGASWRTRRGALLLEIEDLGDDGPVAAALQQAVEELGAGVLRTDGFERAVLERGPDGGLLHDDRRERRARKRKNLERALGPVALVDRADDPTAVQGFLDLEAAGWKGRGGTAIACDPATEAFFREVCRRFAEAGRLELLSLETSTGTVAMDAVVRAGAGSFHLKTAYDETHRTLAPGVALMVGVADRFVAETLAFRDSCTGGPSAMEGELWPARRRLSTVVLPFATPVSRALVASLAAVRATRSEQTTPPPESDAA